jgi:glycosyltransferase involved in cell wall biosynthesis
METFKIALISSQGNVVTPPNGFGGLESVVYDLGCELVKMGHEVTLIAPEGSSLNGGAVIETIDPKKYDFQTQGVEAELDATDAYIEELKGFDIVHDHSWFGAAYASKANNPEIHICHTHHGHCDWNMKTVPSYANKMNFLSISDYMKKENEDFGITSHRVYNGIDLQKYEYCTSKVNRLLFVGRLNSFKQPHVAISAALDAKIPIDIVASTMFKEPGYTDVVEAWANRSKGMVKLYLDADNDVKIKLMKHARACIMPSAFHEPFGLFALESMACGTPIIVTRDGGLPEVVGEGPGSGGFVCDTFHDIVEAIRNSRSISSQSCLKRAEMFSREIMARNYLKEYNDILNGKEW